MNLEIDDIPKMSLAELRQAEAAFTEDAKDFYPFTVIKSDSARQAENEKYYQNLIDLRNRLRAEISRRKQLIDNLSDLTILELRDLEAVYDNETDKWQFEASHTEYSPEVQKYTEYKEEAGQIRNRIREEIQKRMNFLDSLAKLTMAELALTEAGYNKDCEKLEKEAASNPTSSESETYRKKYDVKCEARDMLRAEIVRRRQKL